MRVNGEVSDVLILTEHEHVYTVGKAGDEKDLKVSEFFLNNLGAKIFKIDRGGKITYHGPGQVVGYPIFKLNELEIDVHTYLRKIEEVIILSLDDFGIKAERKDGLTGVWVGDEKIASIGIKVSHWVTMH
ncbi:MAG: lipoyl(octanoyl) transferase LipB, partial [Candidatus Kryptonium sp.]